MLQKLSHYGIKGIELDLFQSFLNNRTQIVEIDGIVSEILISNKYSVIQGSKLSLLLHTTYTNKIPILHNIMNNPIFQDIRNKATPKNIYRGIMQINIQCVDDSTAMIAGCDSVEFPLYINNFSLLLEYFYNANKLFINPDKSKIMVNTKIGTRITQKILYWR